MNNDRNHSRRKLLAAACSGVGAAWLSPFIPRLEAQSAGAPPARFLYWYEPTMPARALADELYPEDSGPLKFRGSWEGLNEIAGKMLQLRGVDNKAGENADADVHERRGASVFTGSRLVSNRQPIVYDFNGRSGYGPGVHSLDQYLARELMANPATATAISDVRAGHANNGERDSIDRTISFYNGLPTPRHQNPLSLYKELFAGAVTMTPDGSVETLLRQRRSILDYARESIARVERRASTFDKAKIEQHLTAIREVELSLGGNATTGNCEVPVEPSGGNAEANVTLPIYNSLMTAALTCGLTRVAGTFVGTNTQSYAYKFLPESTGRFHEATHENKPAFIRAVMKFRASMWVDLLRKMDAVAEENGRSLLDNTIIYLTSDVPRDHDSSDHLVLIAGGGGRFKQLGTTTRLRNHTTNDVLTSIARAFGFNVENYGDANFGKGGLPSDIFA